MPDSFTGPEFIKALSKGALKNPVEPIVREGLVKQDEKHPDVLLFAEGVGCQGWIPIPVESIDRVEFLRLMPCKDHQHPLVRLHLKPPTEENKQAAMYAALLGRSGGGRAAQATLLDTWNCSPDGRLCYHCFDVNGQCVCNWFYDGIYFATSDCGSAALAALRRNPAGGQPHPTMPAGGQPFSPSPGGNPGTASPPGPAFAPGGIRGPNAPTATTVQWCFYGPTAYYDCQLAGIWGVYQGRWPGFVCDNRPMWGCPGGYALVTG